MNPQTARKSIHRSSQYAASSQHSLFGLLDDRPSRTEAELRQGIADTTLDPAHPREIPTATTTLSKQVYRQLLGLNTFKSSFISLYRNLETTFEETVPVAGTILAIAAGVPLPIIGVIFGKIISAFPPSEDEMQVRIAQLLGVAVAYFAVTTLYMAAFGMTGEKIGINLRSKLLRCLLHLPQEYYDTHEIDVTGLLTEKIETIQVGTSEKVGIFIQSISYFVAAFVVGFILNAKLTGILLAAVIPSMIVVVATGSMCVSKLTRNLSSQSVQANGIVESALRAVRIVQAFDIIDRISGQHAVHMRASSRTGLRKALAAAAMLGGVYFIAYAANGLAFYVGSEMAVSGESGGDAGTVFAVCFLILDASFVVGQFAPFLEIFARATAAGEEIQSLLDNGRDSKHSDQVDGTDRIDLHGEKVRFENISFAYPSRPTVKALNGLNLTLKPGTFTAVVGTSGGGKSTLISLLLRIYDTYSGTITIGAHTLRNIEPKLLRSQIAVLEQDSVLFSGTIYDNICHGVAGQRLSQEEILDRCQQAISEAAIDFLDDLPCGVHTTIDNTLQLSGGQKQRICLARALVQRPALLVLDEPTSALDAKSELYVSEAVKKVVESGTTVLMIAHRLSTTLDADQVVVISDGKVIELDSPANLSKPGTVFQGLLDAQGTSLNLEQRNMSSDPMLTKEAIIVHPSTSSLSTTPEKSTLGSSNDAEPSLGFWQLLLETVRLIKPDLPIVLLGLLASIVCGAIILGEAITFGNLIHLLNSDSAGPDLTKQVSFFCLMFFVLACIALVSHMCSGSAFGIASARLTVRVQGMLLQAMLSKDIEWFFGIGRSVHELMSRLTSDSGNLASLSGVALGTIFSVITSVTGGIVLALVVAWKVAVVLLSCVPVLIAAGYLRLRILAKSEQRHRTAYSEAAGIAAESCRSIRTITILGLQEDILTRYHKALQAPFKKGQRFTIMANSLLALSFAITYFVYALAYWWGSRQVRNGTYTQTQFFIVLPALLFSAQGAGQLFSLCPEITKANAAATSIFRMLDTKSSILSPPASPELKSFDLSNSSLEMETPSETVIRPNSKVGFHGVAFTYGGANGRHALHDVTCSIATGESVALVGPSGAGKSSTIALLERFFDPTSGVITIDGLDMRHMGVRSLRRRIGYVPQEPELFPGSITYNIRLGSTQLQTVTQAQIEEVCQQCGLHDFIMSLPEGYNTECGSADTSKLSGGQRQRLSIARAMIRNPEILLLDEPTSALDAHSERQVQDALSVASQGRTTITVAHRLASIQHVNKIMVFDQGTIVEQGTHAELIQSEGLYASMAKAQSLA